MLHIVYCAVHCSGRRVACVLRLLWQFAPPWLTEGGARWRYGAGRGAGGRGWGRTAHATSKEPRPVTGWEAAARQPEKT